MDFSTLKFQWVSEVAGERVAWLEVHRPEAMNALNHQVMSDLERFWAAPPTSLRVLILTGSGDKSFVAGADIKEMESFSREQALGLSERGQRILQMMEDSQVVTIGAINGFALGGGLELALACDILIASDTAKFGLPEVTLGLIPGYGGTQRLARSVGKGVARRIALSGEMFKAEQGLRWGLFSDVVPMAELRTQALKVAETIASRGPVALRLCKKAINEGFELSQHQGLQLEAELFAQTFSSHDHTEGIRAFIEKRKPVFRGN